MIKIIEVTNPFEPQRHTVTYVKPTNCTVCKYVKDFEDKQIFLNGVPIEKPTHCFPQDGNEIVVCPKIGGHSFKKWFGVVAMIGLALVSANVAASIAKMAFAGSHLVAGLAAGLVMTIGGKIINSVFHLTPLQSLTTMTGRAHQPTVGRSHPSRRRKAAPLVKPMASAFLLHSCSWSTLRQSEMTSTLICYSAAAGGRLITSMR